MASSSGSTRAAVGILSIGDMGMGIGKLLLAHGYSVYTNAADRSDNTLARIKAASIIDLPSDEDLVVQCDIILSIVPPRDAIATAKRIVEACKTTGAQRVEQKGFGNLVYMDLNAISPRTSKRIGAFFARRERTTSSLTGKLTRSFSALSATHHDPVDTKPVTVRYLDGGIIGGPPKEQDDKSWKRPSIVVSGSAHTCISRDFQTTLNIKVISDEIGAASTLKACFASFSKGIYALGIVSFTTAHTAGILPELQQQLEEVFPAINGFLNKGLPSVPPKAYRWVDEMKHIGETFSDQGHFQPSREGQAMFEGVSEIYKLMAEDTVLGKETTGKRKRGTSVADIAECMQEGIRSKRMKKPADEKIELAWRSSWSFTSTHLSQTRNPSDQRDAQDSRHSINTEPNEYAKSGTDAEAATHEKAAFDPDVTDPQEAKDKAGKGAKVNPLDASPANVELSQKEGTREEQSGSKKHPE